MMFVGAIPRDSVIQTFRIMPMHDVREAYICCSGMCRFRAMVRLANERLDPLEAEAKT